MAKYITYSDHSLKKKISSTTSMIQYCKAYKACFGKQI